MPEQQTGGDAREGERRSVDNVTRTVMSNLQDQHDWTDIDIHEGQGFPRPLIRGLPPKRLYLHPDDQIEALAHERSTGEKLFQDPELEWVLAVHLIENWSLSRFAAVFDSIPQEPARRTKRFVLAAVHNDSTVVYYLMNEGMVKPRQN
ncbi:tRNA-splicing endonuclease subunit Sen15 [Purpureocillium lavendulum]|uniref:tRNA-splicing endonuclease subunit Sen15 n=1 Tax=Purpureocillium lavendulum TaxID=1247861 RepID=A0AB34FLG9_9HYPO|nr:tRNA-splicing endonuclease subunit Sen15 [Purpureocillium lavendulum]